MKKQRSTTKVITWSATTDGSNMNTKVSLCANHGNGGTLDPRLPRPVQVSHGFHVGVCDACALNNDVKGDAR